MVAVSELGGSGGAERQFSDFFEHLRRRGQNGISLVTASISLERLRAAGRLSSADGVVVLPLGSRPAQGAIGVAIMTCALLWVILTRRYDIVHLCLPTPSYIPFAAVLTRLPRGWRPKVVLSVIDCTVSHNLRSGTAADRYEQQVLDAHRLYFRWVRLDGVYTWYQSFVEIARALKLVPSRVALRAAGYCFTNPHRFQPAQKERLVVYAGRFSEQKRPLLFVAAVALLRSRHATSFAGWRFEMYGGGPLEPAVRESIRRHGLDDVVVLTQTPDLSPVFARSRLFVSTQAIENFTSLAMLEAMAAGNIIVAEDVGQTREFVREGENGYLVANASPDAFADAIARAIRESDAHERMAAASRRLATEVHTIRNFAEDITTFWRDVLKAA